MSESLSTLLLPHRPGWCRKGNECYSAPYSNEDVFTFGGVDYLVIQPSCSRRVPSGRVRELADILGELLGQQFDRREDIDAEIRLRNPNLTAAEYRVIEWIPVYESKYTAYFWWNRVEESLPPMERCSECDKPARDWCFGYGRCCSEECRDALGARIEREIEERHAARVAAREAAEARREARAALRRRKVQRPTVKELSAKLETMADQQEACIYLLCSGDEVIYVGQSVALLGRIHDHRKRFTFDRVLFRRVPAERLNELEGAAIRYFMPQGNRSVPLPANLSQDDSALVGELLDGLAPMVRSA